MATTTTLMAIAMETLEATTVETTHRQTIPAAAPIGGETTKNHDVINFLFVIQNNFSLGITFIQKKQTNRERDLETKKSYF